MKGNNKVVFAVQFFCRGQGRLVSVHSAITCSNFHMSAVYFAFKINQGRGEEGKGAQ